MIVVGQAVAQESPLNTPERHYAQGMRELEAEHYNDALLAFERARKLDPDFPLAYVGIGLIHHANRDADLALKALDVALRRDKNCHQAYHARGLVYLEQRWGKNWRKDAVRAFERALDRDPAYQTARYHMARAYHLDGEFSDAERHYREVVRRGGPFAPRAEAQRRLLETIRSVDPVSRYGTDLLISDGVTRAELAVLLVEELRLPELLEKRARGRGAPRTFQSPEDYIRGDHVAGPSAEATDIQGHWARGWIALLVDAGLLELFSDHAYHPDAPVTRATFAQALQHVYILIMGDPSLATKFLGGRTLFSDVPSTHYAYNAIALCVSMGFLQADRVTGAFGLDAPVPGPDALRSLQDLRLLLENM